MTGHKLFGYVWAVLVMLSMIGVGTLIGTWSVSYKEVKAASKTPVTECVVVATWGNTQIARCLDEDKDREFYMNTQGFMFPWGQ